MKKIIVTFLLSLVCTIGFTQNQQVVDSLKHELAIATQDTSRALILINLCEFYRFSKPDSAMQYIEPALALAQQIKFHRGEALALGSMAGVLRDAGNFSQSLEIGFKGLKIADSYGCLTEKGYCLLENGTGYEWSNDYLTAKSHYQQAKRIFEELPPNNKRTNRRLLVIYGVLARVFNDLNQLDSASYYEKKAYNKYLQLEKNKNIEAKERFLALLFQEQGNTEAHKGNYPLALDYYQQGIEVADKVNEYRDKSYLYVQVAKLFKQINQLDSCIYYAKKGLIEAQKGPFRKTIIDNSALLAEAYQLKNDYKQAFNYQELILAANANLYGIKNIHTVQKMISDEEENRQKAEADNIAYRNRIKQYALLVGLGIMVIIGFILYRNNRQKQKANTILENTLTDLKTAQTQLEVRNRDLEIEAALERVRSRSMGMQKSEELREVIQMVFEQLRQLNINIDTANFTQVYEENDNFDTWVSTPGSPYAYRLHIPYLAYHPLTTMAKDAKTKGLDFYTIKLSFEEKNQYFEHIFRYNPMPVERQKVLLSRVGYAHSAIKLKSISLVLLNYEGIPYTDSENELFKRFGRVFEQTYIRFLDLKKAEAQAREAQIETALEKVRSRSLAMHSSEELQEVVTVVFEKLKELDFDFNKKSAIIRTFSSGTKDFVQWSISQSVSKRFNVEYFDYYPQLSDMWKAKESGKDFWATVYTKEEKNPLFEYFFEHNPDYKFLPSTVKNAVLDAENYSISTAMTKNSAIAIVDLTGTLLTNNEIEILKRFSKVFEQAYIRFLDLQRAEAQTEQARLDLIVIQTEKKRAENALIELRVTQNQLVQKEKLASLGELTAGIAHEIQNPLNFVNNFSELSVDLVKDLKDEIDKTDIDKEYIGELFDDLSSNQEKINHHGKRASSIVKGMLEHSRASTGERALTDINALADEYLRLSYHGMRAKDKSFNADYKTDFETPLSKIDIISQDIGRVLLNLYNNAFYAVHQRTQLSESYTPSVLVSTKRFENAIEIRVKDNGMGMPESVKAKVFQPFFTTKPTGQGTGLGLSLAYDIVTKGHGGTLDVETKEGEGTTFIVKLPLKTT